MRHALPLLTFAAALAGTTTAAHAQTPGGYYVAVPAAPPAKPTLMTRATPWSLQGDAYIAARAPERDAVLCQLVARSAGQLSSFTVGGQAYDAVQLAKCNARAKPNATAASSVAAR